MSGRISRNGFWRVSGGLVPWLSGGRGLAAQKARCSQTGGMSHPEFIADGVEHAREKNVISLVPDANGVAVAWV